MSHSAHITPLLYDYLDGTLPDDRRRAVEAHLRTCPACRAERERLVHLKIRLAALPRAVTPPQDLWPGIAERLEPMPSPVPSDLFQRRNGQPDRPPRRADRTRRTRRALLIAAVVLVCSGLAWWVTSGSHPAWSVARLEGVPRIGNHALEDAGSLREGQWLETDAASRASLDVGLIGSVEVDPNTRLGLVTARATDHRLALERGTIRARIWAPPRLFFVETPSALAVDLGCAYELTVDSTGGSLLHVTSGYVALAYEDRTTVVPAGYKCRTHPGRGPGTPFDEDAPAAFTAALDAFDAGNAPALDTLLAMARPADALTLWYLLYRVDGEARAAVYDRLVTVHPPPRGVSREGMLDANPRMIETWQRYLGLDVDTGWGFWGKKWEKPAS